MKKSIEQDQIKMTEPFYKSDRLTIQQDPILYNDEISSFFGAKPNLWQNKALAFHLLFSSCGPAQWRLNGIDSDKQLASKIIINVPFTPMMKLSGSILILLALILFLQLTFKYPLFIVLLTIGTLIFYLTNKIE
jgi:dimethylaniline monooxygenase (N-oxide forming)